MPVGNSRMLRRLLSILLLCLGSTSGFADSYSEQWGPEIGANLPVLEAADHEGSIRSFEDLKGKNGLLLFMNRSADW